MQAVQPRSVKRVHAILVHLDPVAGKMRAEGRAIGLRCLKCVIYGKSGLFLGGPHIGEYQALILERRGRRRV